MGVLTIVGLVLAAGGVVVHLAGEVAVGTTLVGAGCGSMVAAALVLLVSSPDKRGAALEQGTAPLLALVALALG
ncbi:DUF1304 family protein [Solicola sp. PLA-1-18]|uniref:DUF1304 family protein n=1 Tax=Solicola sp. PLA-1-18 TaxID=3380532 RepID=UPI003B7DEC76